MSPVPPYDAAIVGLGPVGATLAARLAVRGLRVVALDRETAPHTIPRAAHLDGAALAVLAQAGVHPEGRPLDGFDLVGRRGRLLLRGRPAEAPPPGVPPALLIHQPSVERALRERLATLGVEVRLGHTVAQVVDEGGAVRVEGAGPDGRSDLRAAVVVGCDGANSVVREQIGAALVGGRFAQRWLVVDVLVPPGLALPDRLLQIADPARPTTSVPFAAPRHRWEFRLRPGETDAAALAAVPAFLAPHVDPDAVEVERAAVYTFRDVVADRWRSGRVVLAGDAAHQMPPFLGQGLGAGLRDVAVLAPLVEAVAGGVAPEALDAYEAERRPHVAATVRQAVRLGRLVTLPEPLATVRNGLLRAAGRVPALRRRLLNVRG
ncbi:FAD-dependent monooxygenase [Rubrivirga sp. IMCC43871]|uniref:FAD-dependent monooxygenase n=1 Tax=Rubrivirga sp. IMCC43871 TaxID=3391575 RepID=UPI00398FA8C0